MQDYKYLHVRAINCASLVNTQTHIQLLTCYTISSASSAKNCIDLQYAVLTVANSSWKAGIF